MPELDKHDEIVLAYIKEIGLIVASKKHKSLASLLVLTAMTSSTVALVPVATVSPKTFIVNVSPDVFDADARDGICEVAVRKYCAEDSEYFLEVSDSTIVEDEVAGEQALVLECTFSDNGSLDDDSVANGIIVDSIGIARVFTSSSQENNTEAASGSNESTSASGQ